MHTYAGFLAPGKRGLEHGVRLAAARCGNAWQHGTIPCMCMRVCVIAMRQQAHAQMHTVAFLMSKTDALLENQGRATIRVRWGRATTAGQAQKSKSAPSSAGR